MEHLQSWDNMPTCPWGVDWWPQGKQEEKGLSGEGKDSSQELSSFSEQQLYVIKET